MFRGTTYRNIDPKGRLMLPPEFREEAAVPEGDAEFVLTRMDGCVMGYTKAVWTEIEEKFSRMKMPSKQIRDFKRFFIGGAQVVGLDKQGRVLVPPVLRDYAGLSKEVVLVGVGDKFEIWDKEAYEPILNQDYDDISDALGEAGLDLNF